MRAKILFVPMSDARAEDVSPGATTARTINRSFSILELSAVVKSLLKSGEEHKRQVAAFDRECECTRALTTRRLRPAAGRARRHETSVQLSIGSRARSDEAGGWKPWTDKAVQARNAHPRPAPLHRFSSARARLAALAKHPPASELYGSKDAGQQAIYPRELSGSWATSVK